MPQRPQSLVERAAACSKAVLPAPVSETVAAAARRSQTVYRLKVGAAGRQCDVFLVSYPKVGRTWLRLLLGKVFADHYGIRKREMMAATAGRVSAEGMPRILATHDDATVDKPASSVFTDKRPYRDHRVLLMARDPRDVVVSQYFQRTRRKQNPYQGSLAEFVHEPRGSVDTMIAFYNAWADQRSVPAAFRLLRYEDLRADTAGSLRRVLDFIGAGAVPDHVVSQAVEFASFERSRQREAQGKVKHKARRAWNPQDPESFKARRGVVGGYVDYLTADQVTELDTRLRRLDPLYGY